VAIAITKRAQIPFSAWLPAAIAAPTPVSSLVHSSTLVTAGVYLLIRMNFLLAGGRSLWGLALLGAITIIMAGGSAMFEVDIKKIIALSTLRQLGLMFIMLGVGLPLFTFFHLVAHAYFKAILFMSAGGVIHRLKDYQDLRAIGGAVKVLPLAVRIFIVANISLCGIPFLTGFFSKDLILELLIIRRIRGVLFLVVMLATLLTVMYSVRIFSLVFIGQRLSEGFFPIEESDKTIRVGMLILLLPSIFGGILLSWALPTFRYVIFLPR
jgi:NADH-ubiquinone oxidoreductase chain 5